MALGSVDVVWGGSTERDAVQPGAGRPVPPSPVPHPRRHSETLPAETPPAGTLPAETLPAGTLPAGTRPAGRVADPGPCVALAGSGRTELFVVLLIAAMGVALAGVVAFAPWHPTVDGWQHGNSTVIRLDSPDRHDREHMPHN